MVLRRGKKLLRDVFSLSAADGRTGLDHEQNLLCLLVERCSVSADLSVNSRAHHERIYIICWSTLACLRVAADYISWTGLYRKSVIFA